MLLPIPIIAQNIEQDSSKRYFEYYDNEALKQKIFEVDKAYKVISIFDISCGAEIFPVVIKILKNKDNVAFFPISGMDISDDNVAMKFLDTMEEYHIIYRLKRTKRLNLPIQVINMFKYPHRFLKCLNLNFEYKKMGIGDYLILNKDNEIIFSTIGLFYGKTIEEAEEIYYGKLREL